MLCARPRRTAAAAEGWAELAVLARHTMLRWMRTGEAATDEASRRRTREWIDALRADAPPGEELDAQLWACSVAL